MPRQISKLYPQLVKRLAKATYHARQLEKLLNANQLAPDLGIKKQSYEHHVKKAEEASK